MAKTPNPKADVRNPNNPAYKSAADNRSKLLNPEFNKEHPSNVKPNLKQNKK
jgi:hypothetical protein